METSVKWFRVERAVILCENNYITVSDLDLEQITTYEDNQADIQLSAVEKTAIEKILLEKTTILVKLPRN
jgi:uncharacterized protein YqfB (UPF0267 family)